MYRKDETPQSAFDHLELMKLNRESYREPGTGRPTKKDRRDLDEYGSEIKETDSQTE
jgi:ribosome-associated heat shock protein Hsp15